MLYQCTQEAVSRSSSARPVKVECLSINSDLCSPTVDSINALSKASPTLPIDPAIPASRSASVNAIDVYWLPASVLSRILIWGLRNTVRDG